ncbi:MAG: hypothetical protein BGO78_15800 [Chloroflexi bacterium 44-23]|nr:MAG: hypothetical protein BGO78_15800 [Chloroflexi bacterium 44-23]
MAGRRLAAGHLSEDEGEGDVRQKRLDQIPERPEHGLLVDSHEITPYEQQHQVAVTPQIIEVKLE